MPLFDPTLWLVPAVVEEPTASVTDLLVPEDRDSVNPLAIDWLVPRVSVMPLETPLETPLVTPAVLVADTESLTPEVVPDARERLCPTPLERESLELRAAAVLDEVPKESVRVVLLPTEAPAVTVDEFVEPSE